MGEVLIAVCAYSIPRVVGGLVPFGELKYWIWKDGEEPELDAHWLSGNPGRIVSRFIDTSLTAL
ncbi:hypothetical protein BK663_07920 [Pseudomonas lini]|uniref:Uncharacterized protein n=1 Tax=Pseudomonas lini TaxID=163011 RepID=A0A423IR46_9PSED|nr:hypothetical protein BK663_07920 [Pseudomonas lini]